MTTGLVTLDCPAVDPRRKFCDRRLGAEVTSHGQKVLFALAEGQRIAVHCPDLK